MKKRIFASLAVAVMAFGAAAAQDEAASRVGRVGSTLGTTEQIERDRKAVRLLASAPVQQAIRDLEQIYEHDPISAFPDAKSTLKRAAEATATAEVMSVLNQDPDRPYAYWAVTAPHSWGDLQVPLSGVMVDDPDNIYRTIAIDGAARYEIHGQVMGVAPSQETFILHKEASGAKAGQPVRNQETEEGAVSLDKLALGPNGVFTITIDNAPADGRPDHIQSDPDAHDAYLLIRDTLADWSLQNPVKLEVKRTSGPPVSPALSDAQLAQKAADLTRTTGGYWLAWAHKVFYDRTVNTYTHSVARVSGWGFIKCGYYTLKDDEGLMIRLDRRQAAYLGFQLSDVWGQGQAAPFMDRTGSLNGAQARPDADGGYTYVISVADPGVHNWLDPGGLHAGTFCTRWQKLPAGISAEDAVREMKVVELKDLKQALPADTAWVTPEERRAQLRDRAASYARRLTN
jgi:hypothetical protein